MQTEIESNRIVAERVENQMNLLESRITDVVAAISGLKSENAELAGERDSLAARVRLCEERLAAADTETAQARLDALKGENELLRRERASIARRVGELLEKLDLLST